MKHWIFQGNPSRYDVADPTKVEEGRKETWLVSRYGNEIHSGDIVYFWRSGEPTKRGLYAWGTIQSEPTYHENWGLGVPVLYNKRFPQHIPASALQSDPDFRNHLLFRMAIGTNFSLSPTEAAAIEKVIRFRLGSDYAPGGQ